MDNNMKFSRLLEYHLIPEWSSNYIEYRYLKKLVKSLQAVISSASSINSEPLLGGADICKEFTNELNRQIERVNNFYKEKLHEIQDEIDSTIAYIYNLRRVSSLNEVEARALLSIKEIDDNYSRATSMQRTFIELHQKIIWLESFCEFNHIGIHKIILKSGFEELKSKVKALEFENWVEELNKIKNDIYDIIADEFFNGEKIHAQKLLNDTKRFKNSDIGIIGCCCGIWVVMLPIVSGLIWKNDLSQLIPSLFLFRLIMMVGLSMLSFAVVIYSLEAHNINWQYIFEISPSRKISYVSCLTSGILVLTIWLIMLLFHLVTSFYFFLGFENFSFILSVIVFLILFCAPWKYFYREARFEAIVLFLNLMIAPFGNIRFKNYMFGSWTTSMVVSFKDFYLTGLFVFSGGFLENKLDEEPEFILFLVTVLPFIWRILQNVKRVLWKKTSFQRQFLNFFRYTVSVGLSAFAYFHSSLSLLWFTLLISGTLITSLIDIKQDWQLSCPPFKNTSFSNSFLYLSILLNLILRVSGFLCMMPVRIFSSLPLSPELLITVLAVLELVRRSIWSIIRIERERRDNQENFRDIDYIPVTFTKN